MTVNQEPPACSVAFAVAAIVGASVCGSPGIVKSRKWNPKRMLRGYRLRGEDRADDEALGALQACGRLAPLLEAGAVEQRVARGEQRLHGLFDIRNLELDGRLRHRVVGRPLGGAEAAQSGVREGPDAEVLDASSPVV